MKSNECFDCLNQGKGILAENDGWYHPCKFGHKNEGLKDIATCEDYSPNKGFQIGGYYSHMHFEYEKDAGDQCVEWIIHSDGKFPTDKEEDFIKFHICDFTQIEEFVKFWGKKLREDGVIAVDD
jgi:hypothetical protein